MSKYKLRPCTESCGKEKKFSRPWTCDECEQAEAQRRSNAYLESPGKSLKDVTTLEEMKDWIEEHFINADGELKT